ncbi:CheY-like chemotaxis protein [Deinococcus metalli]|uniref:CheY-like chemotaxis protein n=2 Tax=Deinococcus metalli TaxID=1141878 RepID=A0A7W8NS77_9DEIO|nr:response regulator [Deinococcus metalli]MBB5378650.1 CheY-like chemotaxis protein [Deinococcus metalli]
MPNAASDLAVAIQARPLRVLLIEDDAGDAALMEEVFGQHAERVSLDISPSVPQMFTHLRTPGLPRPDALLLDLHLAGHSGLDVLVELKRDPQLHHLPVVILSGSDDPKDIARAYQEHASAYLIKPFTLDVLQAQIDAFVSFWQCCSVIG